jgi:hypothetical protein
MRRKAQGQTCPPQTRVLRSLRHLGGWGYDPWTGSVVSPKFGWPLAWAWACDPYELGDCAT